MHAIAQAIGWTRLTATALVCGWALSSCAAPKVGSGELSDADSPTGEKESYSLQVELSVVVDNPRDVGERYFAHRSTSGAVTLYSRETQSANDWIMYNYHVEIIKLMRMTNGEWKMPTIVIEHPEKRAGQMYWKPELEQPKVTVDNIEDRTSVILADDVASYVFLIRSIDEPTDWRYIELNRKQLRYAIKTHLMIPDLMTMPMVEKAREAKIWWALYEQATFAAHSSKDWPEL